MKKNRQRGLTLVEIMVVIVIIGLVSGLVFISVRGNLDTAKVNTAKAQIDVFVNALDIYRLNLNDYPSEDQGLEALVEAPDGLPANAAYPAGGFLNKRKLPLDPWGNPYIYERPGMGGMPFEVISLGADGQEGGEGIAADISSAG